MGILYIEQTNFSSQEEKHFKNGAHAAHAEQWRCCSAL
jgi:hypothetical protein